MTLPAAASSEAGIPVVTLDPHGGDHHGEAARLRELGPVVRIQLPGDVMAWSVTDHALLTEMIADPRFSKDWRNWNAILRGEISDGWPLVGMVKVTNMVTADGQEHRRLRKLVTQTFTPRRVQDLRPRIERIVTELLDALPSHADADGSVDLRRHFAHPVPMRVICELFGVPEHEQPRLKELMDNIFRSDLGPAEVMASQVEQYQLLARVVDNCRQNPGPDLTSALIAAREEDPDALSEEELVGTLLLMLAAGQETTLGLITNAVRALLTHPDQRAVAERGDETVWANVVEETLRWDAPIGNFPSGTPGGRRDRGRTHPQGRGDHGPVQRRRPRQGPTRRGGGRVRHHPGAAQAPGLQPRPALLPRRPAGQAGGGAGHTGGVQEVSGADPGRRPGRTDPRALAVLQQLRHTSGPAGSLTVPCSTP